VTSPRQFLIGLVLLLLCVARTGLAAQATKTVLVLYDGGREFSSIQLVDKSIESALNNGASKRITLFREYMDLTRVAAPGYERTLREFYRSKYSSNKPDVVVAIRGRPLDFVLNDGDELFKDVPIVSAGMDARQVTARKLPPHVTGTTLRVQYAPTIALALTLRPETENVAIVLGASANDRALEALVRDELREYQPRLAFNYLAGLPIETLLERVRQLPPRTVVLFVSFAQDGNGRSFLPHDSLALIAGAANAPTFINSDDVLDCGAVGGDLISFEAVGKSTAGLVSRILGGERPATIPFADASTRVKTVDARQLALRGIDLERVPADSVVLNRMPTVWEKYGWRIVGGMSLVVFQTGLIATLLISRRRRRRAEQNLRVSEANRRAAVSEERNRMARDMHDTLAQGFTGVIVQLEAARQASAHEAWADTDAHVQRASELARLSLGEARRSIRALRPAALEGGDLCAALDSAMKQMTEGTRFRTEFTTRGEARPLEQSIEENLLRIHQEILTNAIKHSGAKQVTVLLAFDENGVRLEVEDDGSGFDFTKKHDGLGLLGIRERVNQMNGELSVDSRTGAGTRIRVVLPDQNGARA
jgi:signal transduction histidine kinase